MMLTVVFMMSNILYREMTSIPADLCCLDDDDKTKTPPILQSYLHEMSRLVSEFPQI